MRRSVIDHSKTLITSTGQGAPSESDLLWVNSPLLNTLLDEKAKGLGVFEGLGDKNNQELSKYVYVMLLPI